MRVNQGFSLSPTAFWPLHTRDLACIEGGGVGLSLMGVMICIFTLCPVLPSLVWNFFSMFILYDGMSIGHIRLFVGHHFSV